MKIISIFKEDRPHLGKTQINLVFLSICTIFASKSPKVGGAPSFLPPVGSELNLDYLFEVDGDCNEPDFERKLQLSLHKSSGFSFFLLLVEGFRLPPSSSLLTLQRYGKYLKLQNFFKIISRGNENFSPENFGVSQKHVIFATSKHYCGQNAAGYPPAVFVPTLYWNHRITMPCRVSGNRPGVLAIMYSTARSMVTFLCRNIMQIRKENVSAFILLSWREMLTGAARKWQDWKASENVWLTAWCCERVTNGEAAAVAMAVCVVLPAMLCVMGLVLEGGAL